MAKGKKKSESQYEKWQRDYKKRRKQRNPPHPPASVGQWRQHAGLLIKDQIIQDNTRNSGIYLVLNIVFVFIFLHVI